MYDMYLTFMLKVIKEFYNDNRKQSKKFVRHCAAQHGNKTSFVYLLAAKKDA